MPGTFSGKNFGSLLYRHRHSRLDASAIMYLVIAFWISFVWRVCTVGRIFFGSPVFTGSTSAVVQL